MTKLQTQHIFNKNTWRRFPQHWAKGPKKQLVFPRVPLTTSILWIFITFFTHNLYHFLPIEVFGGTLGITVEHPKS